MKGIKTLKKYIIFLIWFALLSPAAPAQILTGAIPNDPGEWTFAVLGAKQTNVGNLSNYSQTLYGVSAGCGLVKNLQAMFVYENGNFSGVPGLDSSLVAYNVTFLYNLIRESDKVPVSVAFSPAYTILSQDSTLKGSNYSLGIVASKMVGNFNSYVDLLYSGTDLGGASTEWDFTLGSIWLYSAHIAFVAENTWQFQPAGYTVGRWSLAAAYSM